MPGCVPRQYARFAGVAHGAKCNAFFDKLVRRGYAVANDCIHNRARLYHVHHKPFYHVIGEVTSRYRRRVPPRLAIERLMLLDAVLSTPDLEWLTTVSEKGAYLARLKELPGVQTAPSLVLVKGGCMDTSRDVARCVSRNAGARVLNTQNERVLCVGPRQGHRKPV